MCFVDWGNERMKCFAPTLMNIPLDDDDIFLSQDMIPIALSQEMHPADLVVYNLFQTSNAAGADPFHFDLQ